MPGPKGGGSTDVAWSSTDRGTVGSTVVLGKLDATASVDFKIRDGMPTSAANVSLALRYMGGGAPAVTVLGHGQGLTSFTSRLNVSAFRVIGGAFRGCLGGA